VRRNIGGGWIS